MDVKSRKPGRIFEWFAHLNAIGWALLLALPGEAITAGGSFQALFYSGWSETSTAVMLAAIGIVGCMALWANGSKPYGSPRFRAAAAAAGAFIYGQLGAALLDELLRTGVVRLGLITYGLMAIFCVYACYQSSRDARSR